MELDVSPPLDADATQALREALDAARASERPPESPWQRAARAEAVERDEDSVFPSYAFSPRSTRGATRA